MFIFFFWLYGLNIFFILIIGFVILGCVCVENLKILYFGIYFKNFYYKIENGLEEIGVCFEND